MLYYLYNTHYLDFRNIWITLIFYLKFHFMLGVIQLQYFKHVFLLSGMLSSLFYFSIIILVRLKLCLPFEMLSVWLFSRPEHRVGSTMDTEVSMFLGQMSSATKLHTHDVSSPKATQWWCHQPQSDMLASSAPMLHPNVISHKVIHRN